MSTRAGTVTALCRGCGRYAANTKANKFGLCLRCYEAIHDRESPAILIDGAWVAARNGIRYWEEGLSA